MDEERALMCALNKDQLGYYDYIWRVLYHIHEVSHKVIILNPYVKVETVCVQITSHLNIFSFILIVLKPNI